MNKNYGQVTINAIADRHASEGLLFAEFDLLVNEIEDFVRIWNQQGYRLQVEIETSEDD